MMTWTQSYYREHTLWHRRSLALSRCSRFQLKLTRHRSLIISATWVPTWHTTWHTKPRLLFRRLQDAVQVDHKQWDDLDRVLHESELDPSSSVRARFSLGDLPAPSLGDLVALVA